MSIEAAGPVPPRLALALELAGVAAGAASRTLLRACVHREPLSLRARVARGVMRAVTMRSKRRGVAWLRAAQGLMPEPRRLLERVRVEPVSAGGVPATWLTPREGPAERTLVYFHGGGYVIGSVATHRDLLARLALGAGARVLGVDYRLAPEHPFPAAQEDALAATRFALATSEPARTAVAGDSAGGALALAALCGLREARETLPGAALLLCPWVDPLAEGGSMRANEGRDFGDRELLVSWIQLALAGADAADPRITPLQADLRGLPPMQVQVGGGEILLDQVRAFAELLGKAGVAVELREYGRLFHVFQAAEQVPEAGPALEDACTFLRAHLPGPGAAEPREPAETRV